MSNKFKSFEEFGQAAKQEQAQNLKQRIDDIFEKSIREDFDSIPVGSFKSSLSDIDSISLVRPTDGNKDILYAQIFSQDKNGKPFSHIWAVLRNGNVYPKDRIPLELSKYKQEEIALEIAGLLERINPSFIHLTDLDIIPLQDKGELRENPPGRGPGPEEKPVDPERIKFLQTIRGAEFEFANKDNGFRGYIGLLFAGADSGFVYLENQYKDNAAYIVDLPEKVDMESVKEELRSERP